MNDQSRSNLNSKAIHSHKFSALTRVRQAGVFLNAHPVSGMWSAFHGWSAHNLMAETMRYNSQTIY